MTKDNVTKLEAVEPAKHFNLHITFIPHVIEDIKLSMAARDMHVRENFDGPIFENIAGYQVNGDWVAVSLTDGTTYAYPASDIARIKHFIGE